MAFNTRIGRAVLELSIEGGAFVRGAGDAKATMRDLSRNIAQAQRDIGKQAFQFTGRQQIADAAKMAEAVRQIGGPLRLVAADQAKVNAALRQGIEYLRAAGKEAPKVWVEYEKATRNAERATVSQNKAMQQGGAAASMFAGGVGMATRALAGYLSAAAITGAVMRTIAYGGALQKAGVALGATAVATQRLENIAVSGNTTLEAMTSALTTMQDRAAGGDKSIVRAFEEIGLTLGAVLAMAPDQQFIAIATALGRISSAERQIKLGKDIFGPRTVEIMGAIRGEVVKTADAVRTMSEQEAAELAKAEEAWNRVWLAAERYSGLLISNGMNLLAGEQNTFGPFAPGGRFGPVVTPSLPGEPKGFTDWLNRQRAQVEAGRLTVPTINTDAEIEALTDQVAALKAAEAAVRGLTAAQRAQLDAAGKTGVSIEGQRAMLMSYGVSAQTASVAQRLLNDTTRKVDESFANLLKTLSGVNARADATRLAAAIASGQLNVKTVTVDAQQAIAKVLREGIDSWNAWGIAVPQNVTKALASLHHLKRSVMTIQNDLQPNFPQPSIEDIAPQLEELEAPGRIRADAARDHAKVMRDLDLQRAEFAIRQAERVGVTRVQILQMESILAQKQRAAQLADADAAFQRDVAQLQKTSATYEAEYDKREQEHLDHVAQINEQWAQGEAERREMIRRESSFWASELGKRIAAEARGALHEATGRIFSTLFAGVDNESKKRAKEAREDYERIARSGKASAEEITRAFRAMRQAEEEAQTKWADRFTSIWDGIKRHLFSIFDAILEEFLNGLLRGMLRGIMNSAIGQKLLGWIPGFGGGGMGGGGGLFGDVAKWGLGKLLGGGSVATTAFSTGAGGALAASMVAPSVASAAVPAAIVSQGASAAVYGAAAGTTAAGAGAGAGAGTAAAAGGAAGGGGSALGFLGNPAFWTNPWTIGIAATAVAIPFLIKGFKKGGWINNAFGGPSKEELAGRDAQRAFTDPLRQKLTPAQREEAMTAARGAAAEKPDQPFATHLAWAEKAVALTHAFVQAGRSAEEGLEALNRLFEAEKKGAKEVNRVRAEIEATLQGRAPAGNFAPTDREPRSPFWRRGSEEDHPSGSDAQRPERWANHQFHAGGVVGHLDAGKSAWHERFGDLKPNEVIAKLLKGEAVLTPEATAAIGGKPVIDMLNGGSAADRIRALITSKGSRGGLGGMIAGGPPSPWSLPFRRKSLSADVLAAMQARFDEPLAAAQAALATPTIAPAGDSVARGAGAMGRHTTLNVTINALDGADVERVVRQKIAPKLKFMMASNQDGMATAVRDTALD